MDVRRRKKPPVFRVIVIIALILISVGFAADRYIPRFTIQGQLLDQDGRPVGGASLVFQSADSGLIKRPTRVVTAKTDESGGFRVGSPREHLHLTSLEAPGFQLEAASDPRSWDGPQEPKQYAHLLAYDLRSAAKSLVSKSLKDLSLPPDRDVFVDLALGKLASNESNADLKISLDGTALAISAVNGGLWLCNNEMPFAPKDDYISGIKCHIVNHNHLVADPYEFEFLLFVKSRNGACYSRVMLRVPRPSQGVPQIFSVKYRLNSKGSRDLRDGPQFAGEELRCDMGGYVAIGDHPWWTQNQGVLPLFSAEDSRRLLGDGRNAFVIGTLAANPNTAPDVLTSIAQNPDPHLKESVARNPSTPATLLTILAGNPDLLVREAVLENPRVPSELISLLEHDKSARIRADIVRREDRSQEELTRYAGDQDGFVRRAVVDNNHCPRALFSRFAVDPEPDVRRALARRADLPHAIINILAVDSDERVKMVLRTGHY